MMAAHATAEISTKVKSWVGENYLPILAVGCALGINLTQAMNVASVGQPIDTLFGWTTEGIWPANLTLYCMVALAWLLGPLAAAGALLTALGVSFAVSDAVQIAPTLGGKVFSLLAVAVAWKLLGRRSLHWGFAVALAADTIGYAALYGHMEIIWSGFGNRVVWWIALYMAFVAGEKTWTAVRP